MLDGGPAGYGLIQRGDHVAVYATFKPGELVPRSALRQILNPAQLNKLLNDPKAVGPIVPIPFKFTAAIVPSARVLNILNPVAVEGSQFSESDIPVTLDLSPSTRRRLPTPSSRPTWSTSACCRRRTRTATRSRPAWESPTASSWGQGMTESSVVAVGTPQSFRQQLARSLEVEPEEVGWSSPRRRQRSLIHALGPSTCSCCRRR